MCHVLIIEDETMIALDLEAVLEAHGATSFAFAAAQAEAVQAARDHRPDIITSDYALLEGTGPQAVALIRIEHGPVPVIFITAMPHLCTSAEAPMKVLAKPLHRPSIGAAFQELALL